MDGGWREVPDVDSCAGKLGIPSSKVTSLERTLSPAVFLKAAEEKAPSPRNKTYCTP